MTSNLLGDILYVDLSRREIRREPFTPAMAGEYLGARGVNARILWDFVKPGIDPLGPENVLIFGTGLLTGTFAPSSGRTSITCKSPATGLYLKTNVGGGWGAYLRYTGHSYIVISGCSEEPLYLWIDDDKVEFRDASHLWGRNVHEVNSMVEGELGDADIKLAAIGPAGENLVAFAAIMCSVYNAAARGGAGAVMGSKKLKAIAVRGTRPVEVADPAAFGEEVREAWRALAKQLGARDLHLYGTSGGIMGISELHALPSYNFQQGYFENAYQISGQRLVEGGYLKRRIGCFSCPIGCHRYVELSGGKYAGTFTGGPEYETFSALGAGCGVSDTEAVIKANALCNTYGLDTISTGSVIQWLFECAQRGLDFDRDGLILEWGNSETVIELIRRIALRQGVGDLLARGVKRASEEMGQGSERWAIQSKGLEQSRVETRSAYAYALAFAINPRGPDHLMTETLAEFGSSPEAIELVERITGSREYASPYLTEKRAEIVRWHEDCYAVTDSLGLCAFASTAQYFMTPSRMAKLFSTAVGLPVGEEEIMGLGRKIVTLERCFNAREGATRADDKLPWRLMHEEQPDRPGEDAINSAEKMDRMLDEYYALHGWDRETGRPTREVLQQLGLSDAADELGAADKLPEA